MYKRNEDLGIRSLSIFNEALINKWWEIHCWEGIPLKQVIIEEHKAKDGDDTQEA